jgi:hypothetical protein
MDYLTLTDENFIQINNIEYEQTFWWCINWYLAEAEEEQIKLMDFFENDSLQLFLYAGTDKKIKNPDFPGLLLDEYRTMLGCFQISTETMRFRFSMPPIEEQKTIFLEIFNFYFNKPFNFFGLQFQNARKYFDSNMPLHEYILGTLPVLVIPDLSEDELDQLNYISSSLYFKKQQMVGLYSFVKFISIKYGVGPRFGDEEEDYPFDPQNAKIYFEYYNVYISYVLNLLFKFKDANPQIPESYITTLDLFYREAQINLLN